MAAGAIVTVMVGGPSSPLCLIRLVCCAGGPSRALRAVRRIPTRGVDMLFHRWHLRLVVCLIVVTVRVRLGKFAGLVKDAALLGRKFAVRVRNASAPMSGLLFFAYAHTIRYDLNDGHRRRNRLQCLHDTHGSRHVVELIICGFLFFQFLWVSRPLGNVLRLSPKKKSQLFLYFRCAARVSCLRRLALVPPMTTWMRIG